MIPATIKALILDMDGVLWTERRPIGDLAAIFARIAERRLRVVLATNNATRTPQQYLERLSNLGVHLEPWQVVTSALAVAELLAQRFPQGDEVYAIGEAGLIQALEERGFKSLVEEEAAQSAAPLHVQAVVMGMDRGISYAKLRRAALLIRSGIPFYATNPDCTFPTPEGLIPGAGALVAALAAATDIQPIFAGKPSPALLELALERLGTAREETLVVGDRLETDIAGGQAAGCPTALVLSGVTQREAAEAWRPRVDVIAEDLTTLVG